MFHFLAKGEKEESKKEGNFAVLRQVINKYLSLLPKLAPHMYVCISLVVKGG